MLNKYDTIKNDIGNTPLYKIQNDAFGNNIFLKDETLNKFGNNHYPRVYYELFQYYENEGIIKPGDIILESGTGSACLAFAELGSYLGYKCVVIYPNSIDENIKIKIKQSAFDTIEINGRFGDFKPYIINYLKNNRKVFFMNHSAGNKNNDTGLSEINYIALKGFENIANELCDTLNIDIFIPILGNGTSVLGPGQIIKSKQPDCKIIGVETFTSASTYDKLYPGKYYDQFGIQPGSIAQRPVLRGTSWQGIDFPHVRNALEKNIINDIVLIADKFQIKEYKNFTKNKIIHTLLRRDDNMFFDGYSRVSYFGKTTLASLAVALSICEENKNEGLNIVVLGYDLANVHDDLNFSDSLPPLFQRL